MSYLPIKQTVEAEIAYKRMLERVEAIKKELGSKYLLAKENEVKRNG
jgi:hypothetical protein